MSNGNKCMPLKTHVDAKSFVVKYFIIQSKSWESFNRMLVYFISFRSWVLTLYINVLEQKRITTLKRTRFPSFLTISTFNPRVASAGASLGGLNKERGSPASLWAGPGVGMEVWRWRERGRKEREGAEKRERGERERGEREKREREGERACFSLV